MASAPEKEFAYSLSDFNQVRKRIYEYAGIFLTDAKKDLVYSRLSRRLRALSLRDFKSYLKFVDDNIQERQHFVNALTTNLTYFFRESHHFDYLGNFLKRNKAQKKLHIWCAAASTGEEPYSIAMTVLSSGAAVDQVRITATDINSEVLSVAQKGVYALDQIKSVSPSFKAQYFLKGRGVNLGKVKVSDNVKALVNFGQLNLLSERWLFDHPVDIIFCRNVMIYFDKKTQKDIFYRMMSILPEEGLYFAGHSENFTAFDDKCKLIGNSIYAPVINPR